MKLLTTLLLLILTFTINAQVSKTLIKSTSIEETHTAFVILPGEVNVNKWDENFIRVTTTVNVANMSENIVKRLIMVDRYSIETKEDKFGKIMVIKMPNIAHYVAVKGVDLIETYTFEVHAPKGYKVVVKQDLNPNINSTLM